MRLLECGPNDSVSLTKNLVGDKIPKYAILSHTWGDDSEEVTLKDIKDGTGQEKTGYDKIRLCAAQIKHNGLRHFWIDTCCIDQTNNNEVSEAINSMFRWYQNATRCYVYLADVSVADHDHDVQQTKAWEPAFQASKWFNRGWTLQELLAPPSVEFYSKDWELLGNKASLELNISEITGIPVEALRGRPLDEFSVADRMLWAEKRETTRKEDLAYSLLGIFGVYMPLIYGEGRDHAFVRLRKVIGEQSKGG
jgi:hypothetical protein